MSSVFLSLLLQVFFVGQGLNDDQWHTLHVTRRGQSMDVKVDSEATSRGENMRNLIFVLKVYKHYKPQKYSNVVDCCEMFFLLF